MKPLAWQDVGDGQFKTLLEERYWLDLRRSLRRYFRWVDSGRRIDAWEQSGVASASRYDRPNIVRAKPHGGYDAGACVEPEHDAWLLRCDEVMARLFDTERRLLRWHLMDRLTIAQCAERLDESADTTSRHYQRLKLQLWHRLR